MLYHLIKFFLFWNFYHWLSASILHLSQQGIERFKKFKTVARFNALSSEKVSFLRN